MNLQMMNANIFAKGTRFMPATFTSFYFLCFYAVSLLIYYIIPGKMQWGFLLFVSGAFYLLTGNGILILYPIAAALIAYVSLRVMAGTEDVKMYIKEGDKVIINKYSGTEVKHEGTEYTIVKQEDVLAIVE